MQRIAEYKQQVEDWKHQAKAIDGQVQARGQAWNLAGLPNVTFTTAHAQPATCYNASAVLSST